MTTKVVEPVGIAPALPQDSRLKASHVDRTTRTIVYWGLMGFGVVTPLVGAVIGIIRDL